MGIFRKRPSVDPMIDELRAEVNRLTARLEASEQSRTHLESQIAALTATTTVLSQNTRADTGSIADQVDLLERRLEAAELTGKIVDDLRDQLDEVARLAAAPAQPDAELSARLAALDASATHLATVEQRVVALGTELGNQLAELSHDIDQLAARQVDDAVLDELRSAQVRLAAEQARYEIAFRDDLAVVAEQVRQLRARRG